MTDQEREIAIWYTSALTTREAIAMVGHIIGSLSYGTPKTYGMLPEEAKQIVREAYATQTKIQS